MIVLLIQDSLLVLEYRSMGMQGTESTAKRGRERKREGGNRGGIKGTNKGKER